MRSKYRTHERQSFFKYMSATTASLVLTKRTLRWSSPVLFNDPFDVPREITFGFTPDDVFQAASRCLAALIEYPPEDTAQLQPKLRLIADTMKKGVSPEIKAKLLRDIEDVANSWRPRKESLDEMRATWRLLIPELRILCLTESPDHIAMWYDYADQYRGVVLEFKCVDELDSASLMARPVEYTVEKPAIYSAEGWATLLMMQNRLTTEKFLDFATFTKSQDWSYEREWRVTSWKRPADTGLYTDYSFDQRELGAIYLGPMISLSDREAATALAKCYANCVVWNVTIGMDRGFHFAKSDI
jgi:Protein of unknown function (DUF2971)